MLTANEVQVGGTHYKSGFQHWDFVWLSGMSYFPAQITRYLSRARKKNGLQDLEKALHYATKLKELLGEEGSDPLPSLRDTKLLQGFLETHPELSATEAALVALAANVRRLTEAQVLENALARYVAEVRRIPTPATPSD